MVTHKNLVQFLISKLFTDSINPFYLEVIIYGLVRHALDSIYNPDIIKKPHHGGGGSH